MITFIPMDGCVMINGISSDTKPTTYRNGSHFIEADTSSTYLFDEENLVWLKYTGGSINMFSTSTEKAHMFMGLSTDEKPSSDLIGSGSIYIEMDTSKTYIYSAANATWYNYSTGGGGGSEPAAYLVDATLSNENKTLNITKKNGTTVTYTAVGDVTKAYVDAQDAKKQDILTAGEGIEISDDNVISATASAELTAALQAGLTVGGVYAGDTFPKGTAIEDVIVSILKGINPEPTTDGKLYFGMVTDEPTEITGELQEQEIPDNLTETGISYSYKNTASSLQYICFVYPTSLGDLAHIYQDSFPLADLIGTFKKKIITNDSITYNLYYPEDPVKLETEESFTFLWK